MTRNNLTGILKDFTTRSGNLKRFADSKEAYQAPRLCSLGVILKCASQAVMTISIVNFNEEISVN